MSNSNRLNRGDVVYLKTDTSTRYLVDCMYVNSGEYSLQGKEGMFSRNELLTEQEKIKKKEKKSIYAKEVLQLMDKDLSYTNALEKVLQKYPKIKRDKLEKELDKYI